jgi:hypothetical protein
MSAARYAVIGTVAGGLLSLVGSFFGSVYTNDASFRQLQLQLAAEERREDVATRRNAYVAFLSEAGQHRRWLNDVISAADGRDQAAYDAARLALSEARAKVFTAAATVYLVGDLDTNAAAAQYANSDDTAPPAVEDADANVLREWADVLDAAISDFLRAADADLPELQAEVRR